MKTILLLFPALLCHAQQTALDRYVAEKDDVFAWKLISKTKIDTHSTYVLELTSQTWRTATEVDKPVWKHWLTITKPETG